MNKLTLINRLKKRYKGSKTSKAYRVILDLVEGTNTTYMVWGNIIRPCHVSGSGRYTKNMDYTEDVEALLDLLGVKYQSGNDAPKGAKAGNFIHNKNFYKIMKLIIIAILMASFVTICFWMDLKQNKRNNGNKN